MTTLVHRQMKLVKREAPADDSGAPPSRVRSFVASSEAVDSYNTVIRADGWDLERFTANPVILFGHQGRELPIGKGTAKIVGKELMLDVEFFDADTNQLSEQVLRILDAGVMGASVGFEPLEWEYNEERETGDEWADMWNPPLDYTKTRLLEVSVVTIPANPEALPVGRDLIQSRMMKRLAAKAPPAPVVTPPPPTVQPVPAAAAMAPAEFRSMVERITREEKQALVARRSGKTSRSRP